MINYTLFNFLEISELISVARIKHLIDCEWKLWIYVPPAGPTSLSLITSFVSHLHAVLILLNLLILIIHELFVMVILGRFEVGDILIHGTALEQLLLDLLF